MHRLMVMYPPQDDPARFRSYYESTHMKLARAMPHVRAMSYGFDITPLNGGETWACVFTCDFDSAEAMGACMASPEGQATAADVGNFSSPPPMLFHFPLTII